MEEERQVALREGRGSEFPEEPDAWFNHFRKFVRNRSRCFKMDGANEIEEHPARKYYNGRSNLENHNLAQVLYHKQMCLGYEAFAKQRAMTYYGAAYAGVQHWGTSWMGDNGGGRNALVWMLSLRHERPHEYHVRRVDPGARASLRLPATVDPAQQLGLYDSNPGF